MHYNSAMEFKCSQCDYASKFSYNVRRHILLKHNKNDQNFDENNQKNNPNNQKNNPSNQKNNPKTQNKEIRKILHENQCSICDKILSNKQNLKRHIISCKGKINKLECIHCKEIFTIPQSKYRHQKFCKEKEKDKINNQVPSSELVIQNINNITTINNNQIYNNNPQTINNNITIQIRNFGDENKEYITNAFLLDCYKNGYYGLIEMIEKIYFNKEHPENHNVRIGSFKNKYFEIHNDNNWIPQGINETLNRMINTAATDIILNVDEEDKFKEFDKVIEIQNPDSKKEKFLKETINSKLIARKKLNIKNEIDLSSSEKNE